MKHPPVRQMTDLEAAWLAGVFDGEGCIVYANRKYKNPTLVLQVGNTSRPLLERIQEVTGSGGITRGRLTGDNTRPFYQWQITSKNAMAVLVQIEKHLIVKRERADLALDGTVWPIGFGLSAGKAAFVQRQYAGMVS